MSSYNYQLKDSKVMPNLMSQSNFAAGAQLVQSTAGTQPSVDQYTYFKDKYPQGKSTFLHFRTFVLTTLAEKRRVWAEETMKRFPSKCAMIVERGPSCSASVPLIKNPK